MHMHMIFWQSQRTTEIICLKKLFDWNTYGVCRELPDQASRDNIAVKKVAMKRLMIIHFEASFLLVVVFTVVILLWQWYCNDITSKSYTNRYSW